MLTIRIMDERLLALQRQGRIGFYGEARGQEAAVIGAAAALGPERLDRAGAARGGRGDLSRAAAAQLRRADLRQRRRRVQGAAAAVSPGHARGALRDDVVVHRDAAAARGRHGVGGASIKGDDVVVLGCLGDGATSEEDFHVAANFAGVLQGAGGASSARTTSGRSRRRCTVQTAAPTMAVKALAYGFPGVRVDGNDVLAVYAACSDAVERARRGDGPTLIEALTYRVSAHSSSDDPSRYRDETHHRAVAAARSDRALPHAG